MQYRNFGRLNLEISALGFGSMRLPTIDNQENKINETEAERIISYAFDNGVNYIDTAYPYHGGNSEITVGKILKNGYRDKVYLADKLPVWNVNCYDDLDKIFYEQLKKLQTDRIDFYLLHNLGERFWKQIKNVDFIKWIEEKKRDGMITYFGFSFHDTVDTFKEIVDSYDWDFCQIQYNYMNETIQAGTEGLEYAYKKQLPIIVMEPLLGGSLTGFSKHIQNIFDLENKNPVEMALKWLWNKKEVSFMLSGMSSIEQVKQNISYASNSKIGCLTSSESNLIKKVQIELSKTISIPCTKCNYCTPCPSKINIPYIFSLYNEAMKYANSEITNLQLNKALYNNLPKEVNASACVKCKKCEPKCPQTINITDLLEKAHNKLYDPKL
ncbi:MAG TPA: aldo/keto reductase [Victivallales bacterium]|nr:aldo/keto reductase [Victivallales bacterium]